MKKTACTITLLLLCNILHGAAAADDAAERGFLRVENKRFVFADGTTFLPRGFTIERIDYLDGAEEFEEFWQLTPAQWLDRLAGAGVNFFRVNVPHMPERADAELVKRNLGWLLEECEQRGIYLCLGIQHGINATQTDAFRQRVDFYIEHFGEHRNLAMWELNPSGGQQAVEELARYLKQADAHKRPVGLQQRGTFGNKRNIQDADWATSEEINWLFYSWGNSSFKIGIDEIFQDSHVALLGRIPRIEFFSGPSVLGLQPGRHHRVDVDTPGFHEGQFNTVTLRHELWCATGMFTANLIPTCGLGQGREHLRANFDEVLKAMVELNSVLKETVDADDWDAAKITRTPGWDQHVMASDGKRVLMHCSGQLDGGTVGYMGYRIPMPDLQPGLYEVRWYSLLTGKLLSVSEERIGNPEKYEVPAVVSPGGPVILYVRPIEITPYVEHEEYDETKLAENLLEFTGGRRVRIAWNGNTASATDPQNGLIVFDTEEGQSRVLAEGLSLAFITADGSAVVANEMLDGVNQGCWLISWDGTTRTKLLSGRYAFAMSSWLDPETDIEWLYVGDNNSTPWEDSQGRSDKVYRHRLDNIEHRELVWDAGPAGPWFRLSADGLYAGGSFPFNRMGVADLKAGTWREYGRDCNGAIAPDNSYQFFHLEGNHRAISFYDFGGRNRRSIAVNNQPAVAERDSAWLTSWSSDVRFMTCMSPEHGNSDIYIGRFEEDFTRIEKWVRVTGNEARDGGSYAWIEPADDAADDGQLVNARVREILAEDNTTGAIRGVIEQAKNNDAGSRIAAQVLQRLEGHAAIELAKAEAAAVVNAAEAAQLYRALAERFDGLDAADTARARLRELDTRWLLRRDKLVLMWQTANLPALAFDAQGRRIQNFSLDIIGNARLGRFYNMIPKSGGFHASGADEHIVAAVKESNEFTFQCRITAPVEAPEALVSVIRWRNNFSIMQQGSQLFFDVNTSAGSNTLTLDGVEPGSSVIITLAVRNGMIELFSGENMVGKHEVRGDLSTWQPGALVFGSNSPDEAAWLGKLEGIAIHAAALDADTIAQDARNYTAIVEKREQAAPVERLRIRGRLSAKSPAPPFEEIAPYTRNLSVYEYEVEEVLSGGYDGEKIYVAHWTLMDRQFTPAAGRETGKVYELVVEPLDAHPQLEPERLSDTLDYVLEYDLYYDVAN